MRKSPFPAILALLLFCLNTTAQVTLSGSSYTQNFDALGASGTTAPAGWTVRTGATATGRGSGSATLALNSASASTGAFNNYQNGTGRCIGVRQTGSIGDPGAAFELEIASTAGKTGFSLSIDHLMLSVQPRSTIWTVQFSVNGTAWTSLGTYTDPGASGTTTRSYTIGTAFNNQPGTVYIRAVALGASTSTGNRDSYGIDNVSLTWTNTSTCALPSGIAESNVSDTGATVSWQAAAGSPAGYEVAVTTSSINPASGTSVTGTTTTVSGLAAATKYYVHLRTACTGSTFSSWIKDSFTTLAANVPLIAAAPATLDLGTVVAGSRSNEDSYTVSAENLTENLVITAPAGFEVSAVPGSGFGASLSLPAAGGTIGNTTVYVRFSPAAPTGTASGNIMHTSAGATAKSVAVSGKAIATEPGTKSTISFSAVTTTGVSLTFTGGGGSRRVVIMRSGAAVSYAPADGAAVSGVSSVFTSAADQGSGNRAVYDGAGTTVAVTGLSMGTTYHVAVYEYNNGSGTSQNYRIDSPATANITTYEEAIYLAGSAAVTYIEDFNSIGSSATAALPAGFEISGATASPVYGTATTKATTVAYGTSGTGAVFGTAGGGFVNWASGITASSTDRSVGMLSTGSYASPRSLLCKVRNATGAAITSLIVAYDLEKSRSGSRAMDVRFYYSLNGSSWMLAKTTSYGADGTNTTVNNPPVTTGVESMISGLSVADNTSFYLRWEFEGVGGSSNSQGIGVDNIAITPFNTTLAVNGTSLAQGTTDNLNVIGQASLAGDVTVEGRLHFATGSKLSLNGHHLVLKGPVSGTTAFSGSSGSALTIGGSGELAALSFDQAAPGASNRLKDLEIDRSGSAVPVNNTLEITGTITPVAGTLQSEGNIVLVSDASGTARIAALGTSSDITGNVTVQRYIPAVARRSRMLSSPVSNFCFDQYIDDMYLSGPGGAANGFDTSSLNSHSIYTYQESTGGSGRGWKGLSKISDTLAAGRGALVFVRGDRTIGAAQWYTPPFPAQKELVVDYVSQPVNKGTISPVLTYTNTGSADDDGWNLAGNPYPSPVDWALLGRQDLSGFYYVYDPSTGSYVADNGSQPIASGQAFFVQATGPSPQVTFTEHAKIAALPVSYFKTQSKKIGISMVRDAVNADKAWLVLDPQADPGYSASEDAIKFTNALINLSILAGTKATQISTTPLSTGSDTFVLRTEAPAGSYWLKFAGVTSLPAGRFCYLHDKMTNTLTDLKTTDSAAFTISPAGGDAMRFRVIITDRSQALPVKLVSFNGILAGEQAVLSWTTAEEKNMLNYTVQYSADGVSFGHAGTVKARNLSGSQHYRFAAAQQPGSMAYYRLMMTGKEGEATYSRIVPLQEKLLSGGAIGIVPNPVSGGGAASVHYTLAESLQVELTVFNGMGEKIYEVKEQGKYGACTSELPILPAGLYHIRLKSGKQYTAAKLVVTE